MQNTPIGNVAPSTAIFTSESVSGNSTVNALTVNSSATVGTTLSAAAGIQATAIGNVTAAAGTFTALTGTSFNTNGNATVNGLAVNTSITAVTTISAFGGLQATPIGNVAPSTAIFTSESVSGNSTVNGLTVNTSVSAITTLSALGGIQNTPIGNATASTGQFTTINTTGNTTVSGLQVNLSATVGTTLGVLGTLTGTTINAATIGNSGAVFTGASYTATNSFNGPLNGTLGSAGGNTAIVSTLSASSNATVNGLTVNNSATVGSTLGVTSNIIGGGYISANNQVIIQAPSPSAEGAQIVMAWANTSGLTGQGNSTWNIDVDNVANLRLFYQDAAGSTAVPFKITSSPGVGNIYMPGNIFVGGYFYSNGTAFSGGGGSGTPGGTSGQLQYNNGGSFAGATNFTYASATGNVSANALTINNSATVGSTLGITGNVTAGNVTAGIIAATDNGNGTNFKVGDDIWIGDIDVANTLRLTGQQDGTQGYIVFGNTNQLTLGRSGSGALTYQGGFTAQGGVQNTPIGNATASTGQFTTIGATGTFTGTTINAATIGNAAAVFTGATYYASGNYYGILGSATNANAATVTTLSANGNATVNGLTVNTSGVFTTTVQAAGGLQATPIGNVVGQASTGSFTTITANGNLTVAAITSNGTITATTIGAATIGNASAVHTGATYTATNSFNGPHNGTLGSAGGNTAIVSTLSASGTATVNALISNTTLATSTSVTSGSLITGTVNANANATVNALTVNTSGVFTTTLQAAGGIQATPIGNVTASTGQFTTASATGNVTGAALTSNTSITAITTLSALGGIQNTPIGNVTPSTALFTTVGASSNVTASALTVNNSATVGTTLGVTGAGIIYGGIQNTPIGNVTPSTAIFTSESVSGNSTVSALTINNSATIGTTLGVTGNARVGNILASGFFYSNGTAFTSGGGISYTSSASPPASPSAGNFWYDTSTDILFEYQNDGTNTVWVDLSSGTWYANATLTGTTLTVSGISTLTGNVNTNNIMPTSNASANIGSGALSYNTIFAKATSALYADLAEKYLSDADYTPGTVLIFGGNAEVTVTTQEHDTRVAGVVSTDPAYLMNSNSRGIPLALTGRVPCQVLGPVAKGDLLVTSTIAGVAQKINLSKYIPGCVIGKSLENIYTEEIKMIEIAVGRF